MAHTMLSYTSNAHPGVVVSTLIEHESADTMPESEYMLGVSLVSLLKLGDVFGDSSEAWTLFNVDERHKSE